MAETQLTPEEQEKLRRQRLLKLGLDPNVVDQVGGEIEEVDVQVDGPNANQEVAQRNAQGSALAQQFIDSAQDVGLGDPITPDQTTVNFFSDLKNETEQAEQNIIDQQVLEEAQQDRTMESFEKLQEEYNNKDRYEGSEPTSALSVAPKTVVSLGSTENREETNDTMSGVPAELGSQSSTFGGDVKPTVTQRYGNRNARYRGISQGINRGTDFAVPKNTPLALPLGEWEVVESFNRATAQGPGNKQTMINRGYGNSVKVKNTKTGETIRYSHLAPGGVFAKEGQKLRGGTVFGRSGATGHVAGKTGEHVDVEYTNERGGLTDILYSPYRSFFK